MPSVPTAISRRHPFYQAACRCVRLWHLCSLDAPTIAAAWAYLFARQCGFHLAAAPAAVLLLGTWLVYVLDRLLDVKTYKEGLEHPALQERHRFHHAHRRALLSLAAGAAITLSLLTTYLTPQLIHLYLALSLPVAVYSGAVHPQLFSRRLPPVTLGLPQRLLPSTSSNHGHGSSEQPPADDPGFIKEAAVALLFASAAAAPAASHALPPQRVLLLLTGALFALLCWLNCLVITYSEAIEGLAPHARRALAAGAMALSAVAGLAAAWSSLQPHGYRQVAPPCVAVLLAALGLLALLTEPSSPERAGRVRILADLALLTPILVALA